MFAMTPIWLWPVLWLSLRSYERWLHAYWAKHGFCEVICRLSRFGTVHVHRIYPPEPEPVLEATRHLSGFEQRQYAEALTPDDVISQPLRKVSETRVPQPPSGLGVQLHTHPLGSYESIRDGPAGLGRAAGINQNHRLSPKRARADVLDHR